MDVKNGIFKMMLSNGILKGEYTNEHCNGNYYPDCARSKPGKTNIDSFEGNYDYAWFEDDQVAYNADLTISSNNNIYTLVWTVKNNNKCKFKGIAQKEGNFLNGTYVSC